LVPPACAVTESVTAPSLVGEAWCPATIMKLEEFIRSRAAVKSADAYAEKTFIFGAG
jgi:hypothetical protein